METLSVHQKNLKQAKGKKKQQPMKVVYISNPIRVKTSESEFKDTVQGLTGQGSDIDDISKFSGIDPADVPRAVMIATRGSRSNDIVDPSGSVRLQGRGVDPGDEVYKNVGNQFDMFEELFTPQMLDSFGGLAPASSIYYDQYYQGDTTFRQAP